MKHISVVQSKDGTKYAVAINKAPGIIVLTEGKTAEEATEKYRQSLLARWQGYTSDDEKHKCEICGKWTQSHAMIPDSGKSFWLCSEHLNDETIDGLFILKPNFEIWSS